MTKMDTQIPNDMFRETQAQIFDIPRDMWLWETSIPYRKHITIW